MAKITKKNGFTLAEVLITLSIIGVVAALTIPAVTRKFEKQQYIAQYKEAYSIMVQVTKTIMADNEGSLVGLWTNESTWFDTYLPYFKVAKNCKTVTSFGNCFGSSYTTLNGVNYTNPDGQNSLTLSNGVSIIFDYNTFGYFFFDLNGQKGPNVLGKDLHLLELEKTTGEIKPMDYGSESSITTNCPSDLITDCNLAEYCGRSCGVRILRGDYGEDY